MNTLQHRLKKAVAAVCGAAALSVLSVAGVPTDARALTFGNEDLVFALYGNNQEFIQNLGSTGTLLAPGASTNFSIDAPTLSAVGGTNAVKWALVSFSYDINGDPTVLHASSQKALGSWTAAELSTVAVVPSWNAAAVWSGQSGAVPGSTQLLPKTDPNSFTSVFGTSGSLAGGFPVSTEGFYGSLLHILSGNYNTNLLSAMGQGVLSQDGTLLTISNVQSPVPVPAAVVLFGTGLVGLVGVARRSLARRAV